jgi:hypothetical protein
MEYLFFNATVLSNGISNLLQPAQAEVVLGQPSTYLASWDETNILQEVIAVEGETCTLRIFFIAA